MRIIEYEVVYWSDLDTMGDLPTLLADSVTIGSSVGVLRCVTDNGRKVTLVGDADATKQLYWARQALEAPRAPAPAGRTEYYTWEESGTARDGRRLAPETVAVPVFIPDPAPAAQDR